VARRVELIVEWQLRTIGERRIEVPALGFASSSPVGVPSGPRTISPPGGLGVSLV
jgi:hypothetical protein